MVRAQGGTETAIVLGLRTQEFYAASGDRFPLDCGFVAQGYLMPCFSEAEVQQAHDRIALQQGLGLDVEWLPVPTSTTARRAWQAASPSVPRTRPATVIDAPRNVLAYTAALTANGVDVRERAAFTGLRTGGGRVVGVDTSNGPIDTERVVLTGGAPGLDEALALFTAAREHAETLNQPFRWFIVLNNQASLLVALGRPDEAVDDRSDRAHADGRHHRRTRQPRLPGDHTG